jgi:hypothetical protein
MSLSPVSTVVVQPQLFQSPEAVQTSRSSQTLFGDVTEIKDNTSLIAAESTRQANGLSANYLNAQTDLLMQRKEMESDLYKRAFSDMPDRKPPLTKEQREKNTEMYTKFIASTTSGANDRGGVNKNEQNALAQMQNSLAQAAEYLKPGEMRQLMEDIGAQTGSIKSWSGKFENGGYKSIVDMVNNRVRPVLNEYETKYQQANADRNRAMQMLTGMMGQNNALASSLTSAAMNFKTMPPAIGNPFQATGTGKSNASDMVSSNTPPPKPSKVRINVNTQPSIAPMQAPSLWSSTVTSALPVSADTSRNQVVVNVSV